MPSQVRSRKTGTGPPKSERADVAETVTVLLHAVDARDWSTVRSSLADNVETDYTSLFGGTPVSTTGDALVDSWKGFLPGFDATQHLAGPIWSQIEGDGATASCAVTATHALGAGRWVVGGHYRMRLARGADGWQIVGIILRVAFVDGDRTIPDLARARAASAAKSTST